MWFLAGLGLAYGATCVGLARGYLRPRADPVGEVPMGLQEETWKLAGHEVVVWTAGAATDRDAFVLVHGYGGSQAYYAGIAAELARRGYAVIVPRMPGHHDSDPTTGFGGKESDRVAEIVRRLRDGQDRRVVLSGVSMGGAACWLATEKAEVDGIVTEGAFARLDEAVDGFLGYAVPGGNLVLKPVPLIASAQSGIRMEEIVPLDCARRWRGRPALIIQGSADRLVPMRHARALAEAAAADLWVVEGAKHARCPQVAGAAYVERLEALMESLP
jgi:pimeloyl-ACP methyl ester carboxylesterase